MKCPYCDTYDDNDDQCVMDCEECGRSRDASGDATPSFAGMD